jgi:hypothetical protein
MERVYVNFVQQARQLSLEKKHTRCTRDKTGCHESDRALPGRDTRMHATAQSERKKGNKRMLCGVKGKASVMPHMHTSWYSTSHQRSWYIRAWNKRGAADFPYPATASCGSRGRLGAKATERQRAREPKPTRVPDPSPKRMRAVLIRWNLENLGAHSFSARACRRHTHSRDDDEGLCFLPVVKQTSAEMRKCRSITKIRGLRSVAVCGSTLGALVAVRDSSITSTWQTRDRL